MAEKEVSSKEATEKILIELEDEFRASWDGWLPRVQQLRARLAELEASNDMLRQWAKDAIEAASPLQCGGKYAHLMPLGKCTMRDGLKVLFARLEELEAQVLRWHWLKDGVLPNERGQYLTITEGALRIRTMRVGWFGGECFEEGNFSVLAWAPIPELPTEAA